MDFVRPHKLGVDPYLNVVAGHAGQEIQYGFKVDWITRTDVIDLPRLRAREQLEVGVTHEAHVIELALDLQVTELDVGGPLVEVLHNLWDHEGLRLAVADVVEGARDEQGEPV